MLKLYVTEIKKQQQLSEDFGDCNRKELNPLIVLEYSVCDDKNHPVLK
jgi:hypothetical protein